MVQVMVQQEAKAFAAIFFSLMMMIGNYMLLNLFLAILIEGFTNKPKKDEDDIFFGEEDIE